MGERNKRTKLKKSMGPGSILSEDLCYNILC